MKTRIAALGAAGMLLLTGCSTGGGDGTAASGEPKPSASASATEAAKAWTAPDACTALDLTVGASIDGTALGACVSTALVSYGSGREYVETSTSAGEVVFRYDPDFEMQGDVETADGPMQLTFLDGVMWVDHGNGPVRGDIESEDMDEMMAGLAGEMYRMYSEPTMTAELIAASASWLVGAEEDVTLGNGEVVKAFPITSAAPFTWNEIPVEQSIAWFAADWTPVGVRGTVSMMGMTETTTQTYYDLGADVEITPVG